MLDESSNRRRETTLAQLRGIETAGKVAKLIDGPRDVRPCVIQTLTALKRRIDLRARRAEGLEQVVQPAHRTPAQALRESAPLGFARANETPT